MRSLSLDNLSLGVYLGCGHEERKKPQEVRFYLQVHFDEPPPGEVTDRLEETVCYAELSNELEEMIQGKEYCLVEKLAKDSFDRLTKKMPQGARLGIKVHKVKPPVKNLVGGVKYSLGDWKW